MTQPDIQKHCEIWISLIVLTGGELKTAYLVAAALVGGLTTGELVTKEK